MTTGLLAARNGTSLSPADRCDEGISLIEDMMTKADADGIVVNLSGGIDSSTTAALAVEAVGATDVHGLCMPTLASTDENMQDAQMVADNLGIAYDTIEIQPILDMFEDSLAPRISPHGDRTAIGNVAARLRMACAYYAANTTSSLVVGTSNRTERLLGYFTKYGDGGTDLLPLGDCYKTDVRRLARLVGVPTAIIEKPPTGGLWAGQTDKNELGASYQVLDPVFHQLVDTQRDVTTIAAALHLEPADIRQYMNRSVQTAHKRAPPTALSRRSITQMMTEASNTATTASVITGKRTHSQIRERLTTFIENAVDDADAEGVVINMSGGIDSSVVAMLAVEALGPDRVYGIILPCGKATEAATFDAVGLAETLGIDHTMMQLHPVVKLVEETLPSNLTEAATTRTHGNLVARLRMLCAYYAANTMSRLVLGTTTRSEWLLGYFTKYGDGGVDLQPLIGLYKTDVRQLARKMGVPTEICEKTPTAGVRANQSDETDFGMTYDVLDKLLWCLVDANADVEYAAEECGLDVETVKQYAHKHIQTHHKRRYPPSPAMQKMDTSPTCFHELEMKFE
ncbi:NAD+ synthase [Halocatena marina]|uniref:NH(3)-dependent NAD(+) synthetase n=2 Tax=Halocatena marina TaxID=2934937 RepID=A0ABD5YIR5_9EURY|nr:NAD+ synthase [Halocatena marina]